MTETTPSTVEHEVADPPVATQMAPEGESYNLRSDSGDVTFNQYVNKFGTGLDGSRSHQEVLATFGPVDNDEVDDLIEWHPDRPIDADLRQALETRQLCVLVGETGSARRPASIAALAANVGRKSIVQLSLNQAGSLAAIDFDQGQGYVLDASAHVDPANLLDASKLRATQARLRKANSYLVILGLRAPSWDGVDRSFHLPWQRPSLEELVQRVLADSPPDLPEDVFAATFAETRTVGELQEALGRIAEGRRTGKSDADSLASDPETRRPELRAWFRQVGSVDQWMMAAVLAFFSDTPRTVFDQLYADLRARIQLDEEPRSEMRSILGELDECRAEIRSRLSPFNSASVTRPHVCLKHDEATAVYLEEFWGAAPRPVREAVLDWLNDCNELDDATALTLSRRLSRLAASDADVWFEVVDSWAELPSFHSNYQAAAALDTALASEDANVQSLALGTAQSWSATSRLDRPRRVSAALAHVGLAGLLQVRHAVHAYRQNIRDYPSGDLALLAESGWLAFSENCAESAELSDALLAALGRQPRLNRHLGGGERFDRNEPGFRLIELWFAETDRKPPLALRLTSNLVARRHLAMLLGSSLSASFRHVEMLAGLSPWADCSDSDTSKQATQLIYSSLRAMTFTNQPSGAIDLHALSVIDDVNRAIHVFARKMHGPSRLAVRRSTRACAKARESLERNQ